MFHSSVFPKSCKITVSSAKLIPLCEQPYRFLEVATFSVLNFPVSFCTSSIAIASVVLATTSLDTAMAQMPIASKQVQASVTTLSQVNVLFVNPSIGDDKVENGGERTPLKTITRALQSAKPNTVIILSKGTYSTETGERFPLMLKPSVSIQGDQNTKGRDIVITGGGDYLSRAFGGKNVTVVGADQAKLTGVTVTNTNRRGYGLWIERSSPIVVANTFIGSTQDGISITGDSQASIRNNYFERNGANGITITGNSHPDVRENVFQRTGFGINVAQSAEPMLVGNRLENNRCGIVVQANAHPILRSNLIQDSKEDGLVAIAQATPDLGSTAEPGRNEFRHNNHYDINASAAKQIISAYGNTLRSYRVAGNVNTNAQTNTEVARTTSVSPSPSVPLSVSFDRSSQHTVSPNNSGSRKQLLRQEPKLTAVSTSSVNQQQSSSTPIDFTPPSNLTSHSSPPLKAKHTHKHQAIVDQPSTRQLNYIQISPVTVEFSAPKSKTSAPVQPPNKQGHQLPVASASIQRLDSPKHSLPVESAPVQPPSDKWQQLPVVEAAPIPNNGTLSTGNPNNTGVRTPQATTVSYGNPTLPKVTSVGQINLRYRVVVAAGTQQDEQLVKFVAPGAFHTVWHSQEVMQVGVFTSRYNADNMVKILTGRGLKAVVEPIN